MDNDIFENTSKPTVFFQASKEIHTAAKITKTVRRLREVDRDLRTLIYATSRQVSYIDKMQIDLSDDLNCNIRIFDGSYFVKHANYDPDVQAAFRSYLSPSIAFIHDWVAPSYPSSPTFKDARVVLAFLGQEVERRLGTTKTMESVCDALILWALEGTNPDKLMSEYDIITKVESVIPTAKTFMRGCVHERLRRLSRKRSGDRLINIYGKQGRYCLPHESRLLLDAHTIEDESLKVEVSSSFGNRIVAAGGGEYGTNIVSTITIILHRTLEIMFERQGFDATAHFLANDDMTGRTLEPRPIIEIAEEQMNLVELPKSKKAGILSLIKEVLRGVFYQSSPCERSFCSRLVRTYILLFVVKNTPEVIEYFNTMAKTMILYIGSDLIIRAISEFYLDKNDQMTVNALSIIRQAGSKLLFTQSMLEEVHSHIHASHREYENVYLEVESLVDHALASQSDRILIRSYYYAKLNVQNTDRPRTWSQYLDNFVTSSKLSAPTSPVSMRSLRDTLCNRLGLEYEPRLLADASINPEELRTLSAKIADMRPRKRQEMATNDAMMILRVDALRRQKEDSASNPYGYRTWYLTQDTVSNLATGMSFPSRRGNKYVMRPEFLINYIAYNPTNAQVKESLGTIFPSVLGVRLGERLDPQTLHEVMAQIRTANRKDPARASSIVSEHADALKSDNVRNFTLKYSQRGNGQVPPGE